MRGVTAPVTTLTLAVGLAAATWLLGPPPSRLVAWCSAAAPKLQDDAPMRRRCHARERTP